ncbi:MAG: KamA family radical SAM protein [Alphaproteobacteria bacterium GM7ARS4]|nr:KamA family radical SAM protein [Alphaproteobacteria bacterium GM7ARS4]
MAEHKKQGEALTSLDALYDSGVLRRDEACHKDMHALSQRYALRLTSDVASRIKEGVAALRRQYVPDIAERQEQEGESCDPIGDKAHSPVKGVIHRYPDRVLLMPTSACAVYCRFCFRKAWVGGGGQDGGMTIEDLRRAYAYIEGDKRIFEVILSGGDPLMLSVRRLGSLLRRVHAISHVGIMRIHSRVLLSDMARLSDDHMALFASLDKPLYMVVHCNHAQEFTQTHRAVCKRLLRAGVVLLGQSVLLRGINDTPQALTALFRAMLCHHIKPYYLHQLDYAQGTGHFRVPLKKGLRLVSSLRGWISGLCQPHHMVEIAGGYGKVPLCEPCHRCAGLPSDDDMEDNVAPYRLRDYRGQWHDYRG